MAERSCWACTYPKSEGANFWLSILTDLQSRGVRDILIACVDGLKGFPDAIASVFPDTTVQLCIVHQIRNSIKYVACKNQKAFMKDLKLVYQAVNKEAAENALKALEDKWGEDYPIVIKSWEGQLGTPQRILPIYRTYPQDNLYDEHRGGVSQATS